MPGFEALTAVLGFDALYDLTEQRLIATGRTWVPPTDYRSLAPFAQLNLALFDKKLRLAGGLPYEDVRIHIDHNHPLAPNRGVLHVAVGTTAFHPTVFNTRTILRPWDGIPPLPR